MLIATLGRAETEAIGALIIHWHVVNNHTTWQPVSRIDLLYLIRNDANAGAWLKNPFWCPDPFEFASKGFIDGWIDQGADVKGTLTDKFFAAIAKKVPP